MRKRFIVGICLIISLIITSCNLTPTPNYNKKDFNIEIVSARRGNKIDGFYSTDTNGEILALTINVKNLTKSTIEFYGNPFINECYIISNGYKFNAACSGVSTDFGISGDSIFPGEIRKGNLYFSVGKNNNIGPDIELHYEYTLSIEADKNIVVSDNISIENIESEAYNPYEDITSHSTSDLGIFSIKVNTYNIFEDRYSNYTIPSNKKLVVVDVNVKNNTQITTVFPIGIVYLIDVEGNKYSISSKNFINNLYGKEIKGSTSNAVHIIPGKIFAEVPINSNWEKGYLYYNGEVISMNY